MDWQTKCSLPDCDNVNCCYQQSGKCTPNDEGWTPENCDDAFVNYEKEEPVIKKRVWEEQEEDDDGWDDDWEDEIYE